MMARPQQQHPSKLLDVPYVDAALLSILAPRVHGYLRDVVVALPSLSSFFSDVLPALSALDDVDVRDVVQLLLSALMAFATIGRGVGTPAMNALGLELKHESSSSPNSTFSVGADTSIGSSSHSILRTATCKNDRLERFQRVATYVMFSGLLPTAYRMAYKGWEEDKDDEHQRDRTRASTRESNGFFDRERLARKRRRMLRDGILRFISFVVPPVRLANHLYFIVVSGRGSPFGKPSTSIPSTLPLRLSGLSYVNAEQPHGQQHVNYSYAYRRNLYEQMFTLVQVLLPATQHLTVLPRSVAHAVARLRQKINMCLQHLRRLKSCSSQQSLPRQMQASECSDNNVPVERRDQTDSRNGPCEICGADPIILPYVSSCGRHRYCYYCIRFALLDLDQPNQSRRMTYKRG